MSDVEEKTAKKWSSDHVFTSPEEVRAFHQYMNTPEGFVDAYIKNDIELCHYNRQYVAVTKLIYSGIDICANLLLPDGQEAKQGGFEIWVKRFMDFKSVNAPTPTDLWVARCGLLHAHSPVDTRNRQHPSIISYSYAGNVEPPIINRLPKGGPTGEDMIYLPVNVLKDVFFSGIDTFVSKHRKAIKRTLVGFYPYFDFREVQ